MTIQGNRLLLLILCMLHLIALLTLLVCPAGLTCLHSRAKKGKGTPVPKVSIVGSVKVSVGSCLKILTPVRVSTRRKA